MTTRAKMLLALLGACAPAPVEAPPLAAPARAMPPLAGPGPSMPGPAPRREPIDALALQAGCVRCHEDVAAEWSASEHRSAYVDPMFQHALAIEPLPFCRGCHAPEADPSAPAPASLAAIGVACVSCHVVDGVVLAAVGRHAQHPGAPPDDPHAGVAPPVSRQADFGQSAACARCHEFAFPDRRAGGRSELMQSTLSEAAMSPFAESACASCHMPARGTRRSHAFASTRSPEALAAALSVRAERHGQRLSLILETRGVGHAFPTGDLFRRLSLSAEAFGDDMNLIARARRHLARHFTSHPSPFGLGRVLAADDRPGGRDHGHAPLRITLDLGPAAERARIHWEVAYERVDHPAPQHADQALVRERILLAHGEAHP